MSAAAGINLGYPCAGGWGMTLITDWSPKGPRLTPVQFSLEQAAEIAARINTHLAVPSVAYRQQAELEGPR